MRPLRLSISAICLSIAMGGTALALEVDPAAFLPTKSEARAPEGAAYLCQTHDWACSKGTDGAELNPELLKVVRKINRAANVAINPITDLDQYAVAEHWALPGAQGGDCEDYAMFKKQALIEAGVSADRLLLAVVLDRKDDPHAVLVLRTDRGDYVLDNVTNRILLWDRTGYTFISMQNPDNPAGWVTVFEQAERPKKTLRALVAGLTGKSRDPQADLDSAAVETGGF